MSSNLTPGTRPIKPTGCRRNSDKVFQVGSIPAVGTMTTLEDNFLNIDTVARMVYDAGFRGRPAVIAIAIIGAESGYNEWAFNLITNETRLNPVTGETEPNPAYLSLDVGIVQRNSYWNQLTAVDMQDMMDAKTAIEWMFEASDGGMNFGAWNTFHHPYPFIDFVPGAQSAWERVVFAL